MSSFPPKPVVRLRLISAIQRRSPRHLGAETAGTDEKRRSLYPESAREFAVPETSARKQTDLVAVNEELRNSLARCRELLADCRSKLVANSNEDERSAFLPSRSRKRLADLLWSARARPIGSKVLASAFHSFRPLTTHCGITQR